MNRGRNLTTAEFIRRAKLVHGDEYDYSKVEYEKLKKEVIIICPKHGEFKQIAEKHLIGHRCRKCSLEKRSDMCRKTIDGFINKSKKIHGEKYDYSKVNYVNAHTKVEIICPKHGAFFQKPNDHLNGHGCLYCSESRLEKEVEIVLTNNNIKFEKEKRFEWLGLQRLDFYLPEYNIAIECQGGQHFKPIEYFGGDKELNVIVERDKRKLSLCKEHGINIIYYGNKGYCLISDEKSLLGTIKTSQNT